MSLGLRSILERSTWDRHSIKENPGSAIFNEAELKQYFDYAIKLKRKELFSQKKYKY